MDTPIRFRDTLLQEMINKVDKEIFDVMSPMTKASLNSTAKPLSLKDLQDSLQKLNDEQFEHTREFWRDLAQKYGPHILASAHIDAVVKIEQEGWLLPNARPGWLNISKYLDSTHFIFFKCSCLCHCPFGNRSLNMIDDWCCRCSAYEDM